MHQVKFTGWQALDSNVVFPRLKVGCTNFVEEPRVDVGSHDASIRADLVRKPPCDRSAPPDFETVPSWAEPQAGNASVCDWIKVLLQ
jgi:hypothetical protein